MILGGDQLFVSRPPSNASHESRYLNQVRAHADMEAEMHELLGQERKDWTCHPQLHGCQDFNPAVGLEDDISRLEWLPN